MYIHSEHCDSMAHRKHSPKENCEAETLASREPGWLAKPPMLPAKAPRVPVDTMLLAYALSRLMRAVTAFTELLARR